MHGIRPSSTAISIEASRHKHLRNCLLEQIPDLDAETLADTLEGITDLRDMLAELVRSALEDEALASGLSIRAAEMKSRLDRPRLRAEKKRALALTAMSEAEIRSLLEPDFTASLRRGSPVLEVSAEELIPTGYWKPQPPKLDRQLLLTALKEGAKIEGAAIATPTVQLSVRTK